MFTEEEIKLYNYTPEDVEVMKKFRNILAFNEDDVELLESYVSLIIEQASDIFVSELETYPGTINRKSFVMCTPEVFKFKGSFWVPLIYARMLLKFIDRNKEE